MRKKIVRWSSVLVLLLGAGLAGLWTSRKVAVVRAQSVSANQAPYSIDYQDQTFDPSGKRVGENLYTVAQRRDGAKVTVRSLRNGNRERVIQFFTPRRITVFANDFDSNISTMGDGRRISLPAHYGCMIQYSSEKPRVDLASDILFGRTVKHTYRAGPSRIEKITRANAELDCAELKRETGWLVKGLSDGSYTTHEALRVTAGDPPEDLFRLPEKPVEMTPYQFKHSIAPEENSGNLQRMEAKYYSQQKLRNAAH